MKLIGDFWWPDHDEECHKVVPFEMDNLAAAMALTKGRSRAIQAGGNVGVWPKHLAKFFDEVITFEPDDDNFECLRLNVPRVTAYNTALSDKREKVCVMSPNRLHDKNCGAYQVFPGDKEAMRIDDLGVDVDLIYLDVEGYELFALKGAEETIKRCRPVIAFEDKALPYKYGVLLGDPEKYVISLGYKVEKRVRRDVICTPC